MMALHTMATATFFSDSSFWMSMRGVIQSNILKPAITRMMPITPYTTAVITPPTSWSTSTMDDAPRVCEQQRQAPETFQRLKNTSQMRKTTTAVTRIQTMTIAATLDEPAGAGRATVG